MHCVIICVFLYTQTVFNHLHLQPKEAHDVDFSRVRHWCLNGWSKYYCQTAVFSNFPTPEINALFNKHCFCRCFFLFSVSSSNIHICYRLGYAGKVKVDDSVHSGTICQVVAQLPQVFHRMESQKLLDLPDARFQYFVDKVLFPFVSPIISVTLFLSQVLPAHTGALMAQTLIYVPSYFDFIRLRNYMKKEEINFTHLNE